MEKEGHPASKKCIKKDLFIEKQGGNMQLEESTEKSMTQLHSVITNIHVHLYNFGTQFISFETNLGQNWKTSLTKQILHQQNTD